MAEHSPLPWREDERARGHIVDKSGRQVAGCMGYSSTSEPHVLETNIANTELIVHRVNTYDALLAALKEVDARYRLLLSQQPYFPDAADERVLDNTQTVLAKAEGREAVTK